MADLIDRQTVVDMLQRLAYDDWNQGVCTTWANAYSECADMVEDLLSADAVKVVRCKDCNHYSSRESVCKLHSNNYEPCVYMNDDDFCSRGERKDG